MYRELFQMGLAADLVNTGESHGRISCGQDGSQNEERLSSGLRLRGRESLMPQRRFERSVCRGLESGQCREVPRRCCPDKGHGPGLSHGATVAPARDGRPHTALGRVGVLLPADVGDERPDDPVPFR